MKIQFENNHLIIFESELFRTTSTLIKGEDYILLVDPNWLPREIDFIKKKADKFGKGKKKFLLFTHFDYDHIIGYGKFKKYKTIASQNFARNKKKKKIIQQINTFDDEYYIHRDYKIEYPKIDLITEKEKMTVQIMSDKYIFYQATGHNSDGIIAFNQTKGVLIAGDYLSNIEFPYIYNSFKNYQKTLKRFSKILEEEKIKILIPGHGDFTKEKKEIKVRIQDSKEYLKELKSSVKKNVTFNLQKLFSKYKFPISMKNFHKNNIKLVKEEFRKNNS